MASGSHGWQRSLDGRSAWRGRRRHFMVWLGGSCSVRNLTLSNRGGAFDVEFTAYNTQYSDVIFCMISQRADRPTESS